jgi:transglutaminase-like putative cysteine protease
MRLWIGHLTRYRYSDDVSEAHMEVRLRPAHVGGQRVQSYHLEVRPQTTVRAYVDGFGNHVQYFNLLAQHAALEVVSRVQVETGQAGGPGPEPLDLVPTDLLLFRAPVLDTAGVRRLGRRARLRDPGSRDQVLEALDRTVATIAGALTYTTDVTTVSTNVEEALKLGRGVCQDFAHVFIAVARAIGVPCRYASGYVYEGDGEPFIGASHAWAEAWVPDRGWTAYDPTHPGLSAEHYVRLAVGRDYRDAAPTRGVFMGSAQSAMEATVEIRTTDAGTG